MAGVEGGVEEGVERGGWSRARMCLHHQQLAILIFLPSIVSAESVITSNT